MEVLALLVQATVFKTVGLHGNHVIGGFDSHALPPFKFRSNCPTPSFAFSTLRSSIYWQYYADIGIHSNRPSTIITRRTLLNRCLTNHGGLLSIKRQSTAASMLG